MKPAAKQEFVNKLYAELELSANSNRTYLTTEMKKIQNYLIKHADPETLLKMFKLSNSGINYQELHNQLIKRGNAYTSIMLYEDMRTYNSKYIDKDLLIEEKVFFMDHILEYDNPALTKSQRFLRKKKFNLRATAGVNKNQNRLLAIAPIRYVVDTLQFNPENLNLKNITEYAIHNGNASILNALLDNPMAQSVIQDYIHSSTGAKVKLSSIQELRTAKDLTKSLNLYAKIMSSKNANAIYLMSELNDLDDASQELVVEMIKKNGTKEHIEGMLVEAPNYDVIKSASLSTINTKFTAEDAKVMLNHKSYTIFEKNKIQSKIIKLFGFGTAQLFGKLLGRGYDGPGCDIMYKEILKSKDVKAVDFLIQNEFAARNFNNIIEKSRNPELLSIRNYVNSRVYELGANKKRNV